jgi:heptaprenyl diphosphate synthase
MAADRRSVEPGTKSAAPAGQAPVHGTALRARLALYATAAALLFVLERLVPNPVPWVRLGLANIVTLVVLLEHGALSALVVVGLRLVLGAFFAGTLLGPQFLLSGCGAVASWGVMAAAVRWGERLWSPLGVSLLGSAAHAVAQLALANALFATAGALWVLLPFFLGLSIVTGGVTGVLASAVVARLALARRPAVEAAP